MITQNQFDTLLVPMLYHHFELGAMTVPAIREQLFSVRPSSMAEEKGTGIGGVGVDPWDVYKNSKGAGSKGTLEFSQLYTQTYTHIEYPVRFSVKKQLLLNDQYGVIQRNIQNIGISATEKQEVDAHQLLNNAFATDTWSDGQFLCDTDHPVGGTTHSNRGTTALSEDAISATRILMMRFPDDKGMPKGVMADELWVPPELEDTALKMTRSLLNPATGNNAINPQAGRFQVYVAPRLSDTNNWFMTSSVWRKQVVNWYEREAFQIQLVYEDTTDLVYEAKLHYSWGVDDWRWIYGHIVA